MCGLGLIQWPIGSPGSPENVSSTSLQRIIDKGQCLSTGSQSRCTHRGVLLVFRTATEPEVHINQFLPRLTAVARATLQHFTKHTAYLDPGNWGVDLQAGSEFGCKLLFVVLLVFLRCTCSLFLGSVLATQDRVSSAPFRHDAGDSGSDAPATHVPQVPKSIREAVQVIPLEEEDMPTSRANRENNFVAFIKAQLYHGVVDMVISLLGLAVAINAMILILANNVCHQPQRQRLRLSGIAVGAQQQLRPNFRHHKPDKDVTEQESAASSSCNGLVGAHPHDPFSIRNGFKNDDELAALRRRSGHHVERFYRRQNKLIVSLLKPMDEHIEDARIEEGVFHAAIRIAIWASLLANLCLCFLQMYAAITSASLSLLSTGIDAVFDVSSNVMLFWLHKKALELDVSKWPVGGARLETIGNIVYGFLMGAVNLIVVVESARVLITREGDGDTNALHLASLIEVAVAWGVKFVLFVYCFSLRKKSSQVEVLWQDHRNDLWINGLGILMSAGGSKIRWYLDPLGAIIARISSGVIIAWGRTIHSQFELLAGKSAPQDFIQLLIYNTVTFNDEISKVDTVRAYHSGPDYFVEVDVVMDRNTPLWKAHNLSEQLQNKLEELPGVERAFVHVDHETTHVPEHRK
ncbi:Metal tolerance protein 7 [Grifola frondosa]|uniref:Metal tolerance protein 7 n=1 Tax=Grifola frondosa TaxID=5627 RepID=A0A1C7MPK6_GRIFR|nr:Metal tolerance protein 7 [Grifola frondosa]